MVAGALRDYFFEPGSAWRLGVSRALFYFWCLVQVFAYQPWDWGHLPREMWSPAFVMFFVPPPTPTALLWTSSLLVLALLSSCLGFYTRVSASLVAPLITYVFGAVCSFGWMSFHHSPLVLISWVLAFSHCGDAFSLDALRQPRERPDHGEYCWPIRMSWLVLVSLMFCAGYHKLLGSWLWKPGETITWVFLFKYTAQAAQKGLALPDFLLRLVKVKPLMNGLAWGTLVLELFAPLALWNRWLWLRVGLIGGLFCMQLSLACLSTLASFPWLAAYIFWIPWERLKT